MSESRHLLLGKWAIAEVPHRGWACVGDYDLGPDPDGMMVCEMCERQDIRYVHVMEHPDYPDHLEVGCICSGNMGNNYRAPVERERRMKRAAKLRSDYLALQWRTSQKGNPYLKVRSGAHAVVFPKRNKWSAKVEFDGHVIWAEGLYASARDAEAACINRLVDLIVH